MVPTSVQAEALHPAKLYALQNPRASEGLHKGTSAFLSFHGPIAPSPSEAACLTYSLSNDP